MGSGRGDQPGKKSSARRSGSKVASRILVALRTNTFPLVPRIWSRFKLSFIICFAIIAMMVIFTTNIVPFVWQIPGYEWALIIPLALVVGCHILFPVSIASSERPHVIDAQF